MNILKTIRLLLSTVFLIVTNINAQNYASKIEYEVAFIPLENKTDLKVKVSTQSNVPLKINELKDVFGISNIHNMLCSFRQQQKDYQKTNL